MANFMASNPIGYSISDSHFSRTDEQHADNISVREDSTGRIYDLEERTAQFGEKIVLFAKKIPKTPVNLRLITQLVGAGTSVGANYCEADDGVSRADFKCRIGTCRKESGRPSFSFEWQMVKYNSLYFFR